MFKNKKDPTIYMLSTRKPLLNIKTQTDRLKLSEWSQIYHMDTNQKKAGAAMLISEVADFRAVKIIRGKERHYTMINGRILQ